MGKLKSAKEILESIGFKKDSQESTQMAYLRFLKNNAALNSLEKSAPKPPEQLEFDLGDDGPKSWSAQPKPKRVSNR